MDCLARKIGSINILHDRLTKLLREYYFVGGMPEAVKTFVDTNDVNAVRQVQNDILFVYRSDMSKHVTPTVATRISMVWQSIPAQLAHENKKFVYGAVKASRWQYNGWWMPVWFIVCRV